MSPVHLVDPGMPEDVGLWKPNRSDVALALQLRSGWVALCQREHPDGAVRARAFNLPAELDAAMTWVRDTAAPDRSLSLLVGNLSDEGAERINTATAWAAPRSQDVESFEVLAVDLDPSPEVSLQTYRSRLAEFSLPPTMVVHSGRGLHVFWKLTAPVKVDEAREVAGDLVRAFGCDEGTRQAGRHLRLAGTWNPKDDAQRLAKVECVEPGSAYDLGALSDAACKIVPRPSPPMIAPRRFVTLGDSSDWPARYKSEFVLADEISRHRGQGPNRDRKWTCVTEHDHGPSLGLHRDNPETAICFGAGHPDDMGNLTNSGYRSFDVLDLHAYEAGMTVAAFMSAERKKTAADPGTGSGGPIATGPSQAKEPPPPDAPWDDPRSYDSGPPPQFPTEALPDVLRMFVESTSECTQTPPDLAGTLSLTAMSAACAKKFEVRYLFTQPVNLYAVVAMDAGTRKSPVFDTVMAPLRDAEDALQIAEGPAIQAAAQRHRLAEQALKKYEDAVVKAGAHDRVAKEAEAASALAYRDSLGQVPSLPRLLADDWTPEELVGMLARHEGRLAVMSEEGGLFDNLSRYNGGVPNLDGILKSHDGGGIRVDRIGREPLRVDSPALTLGLAAQPDVLAGLAKKDGMNGRGLLARFLYALPDLTSGRFAVGSRATKTAPVPELVRRRYEGTVTALAMAAVPPAPVPLTLTDEAALTFDAWMEETESRRDPATGDLGESYIQKWAGKIDGQTLRLAGLLHLALHAGGQAMPTAIERTTVESAIQLMRYYIAHAKRAHLLMFSGARQDHPGRAVLHWLRRKETREFSVREAHRQLMGQNRFHESDSVQAAVDDLVERGYLRVLPPPERTGPGMPPRPRYAVHPDVHQ